MRHLSLLLVLGVWSVSPAHAAYSREECGKQFRDKVRIYFYNALFNEEGALDFPANGGVSVYSEEGANSQWEVDAEKLTLLANGRAYDFKSAPTHLGGKRPSPNWAMVMNNALVELRSIEGRLRGSSEQIRQAKSALSCAYRIVVNAVARGQESLLASEGK